MPAQRRSRSPAPPLAPASSQTSPEIRCEAQQIGKHASCRHLRTRSRTLHDERIVAVTARLEAHHVVGQGDVGERVADVELSQSDAGLAGGSELSRVAQYFAARACGGQTLAE